MTNVPNDIREMWADVYRLFDLNYTMPHTAESWKKFWEQADKIMTKYKNIEHSRDLVILVSEMLEAHIVKNKLHPCTLEDMKLF